MGADIHLEGRTATVRGVERLSGAPVTASGFTGICIPSLGGTRSSRRDRRSTHLSLGSGLENLEIKLTKLGAMVSRESE